MKDIAMPMTHSLIVSAVLVLSACSNYPSAINDNFGSSVRQVVQMQTAMPSAQLGSTAIAPSDGQSIKSALDRYQKSFEVIPPTTNVFNIGIGSGAGAAR